MILWCRYHNIYGYKVTWFILQIPCTLLSRWYKISDSVVTWFGHQKPCGMWSRRHVACGAGITWLWSKIVLVCVVGVIGSVVCCRPISHAPLTGVCLVVAVGLTQDLTLILSTKNTKQNKTNKQKQPKQEFIYCKSKWRGIHGEEDMLCLTASLITKI